MEEVKMEGRLGKIEALLAKTVENGCTAEEAQSAAAAAQRLMTSWGIEEAMLRLGKKINVSDIVTVMLLISGTWFKQRMHLYSVVATVNDCRCVFRQPSKDRRGGLFVTGFKEDVERIRQMAVRLDHHMLSCLRGKQVTHSWKVSFLDGYRSAVSMRLNAIKRETTTTYEKTTPGMGLALVNKTEQVNEAWHRAHPHVKTSRGGGSRNYNGDGYREGASAGSRVDISSGAIR